MHTDEHPKLSGILAVEQLWSTGIFYATIPTAFATAQRKYGQQWTAIQCPDSATAITRFKQQHLPGSRSSGHSAPNAHECQRCSESQGSTSQICDIRGWERVFPSPLRGRRRQRARAGLGRGRTKGEQEPLRNDRKEHQEPLRKVPPTRLRDLKKFSSLNTHSR